MPPGAPQNGIVGVNQLGPDKYQVQLANGGQPIFTAQPGASLFDRYKQAVGLGARTALSTIPLVGPALANMSTGEETEAPKERIAKESNAQIPGQPPPESPAAVAPSAQAPIQEQSQPQPQPSPPPAYAAEGIDPVTQKKVYGPVEMVNGQPMIRVPGSRGSPGGVTKLGQQTLDERAQAAQVAAEYGRKAAEAQKAGVDLAIEQNENEKAFLQKQHENALLEEQNQRDEQAAAEKHVAELDAKANAAATEYASSRPPEQTTAQSIASGIGAALGAFGASLARTPNFAAELIQQLAANRMRKWEAEVAIKGKNADNLLARYKDALGDMKLAKSAVKATLLKQATIEFQQTALSTKSEQMANNYRQLSAASSASAATAEQEKEQAFRENFYTNKLNYRQGTAGTPGGLVPMTQESYKSGQGIDIAGQDAGIRQYAAQQKAADKATGLPHVSTRGQATMVAARVARGAIQEAADALGAGRDPQTGEYRDPDLVTIAASKIPFSDTRQKMNALKLTLMAEVGKAQTGGVLTEGAAHEMQSQIDAASTPGEWGALLRHYDRTMQHVENTVLDVAAHSKTQYGNEDSGGGTE